MAIDMGSEVDRQNDQLDRLNDKVHHIKLHIPNIPFISFRIKNFNIILFLRLRKA